MHGRSQVEQNNSNEEVYSPEAKAADRTQIADDLQKFLKKGGNVDAIARGERADPPRKPENNYGRGSI